jgi:chromosome segregation protein
MRVKKIEIFGFKSFATKQSLSFGEGVTAVVGPNGCGKSNVVDALRWVMGEQNPRHLRGGSMQDIIFCGSEKKAPLGFAEVVLTIENDTSDAPLEYNHFNEIEITRRLYKTGESEYEINKQKSRLKDISDFFLGTGVGTKAYSIIEQGRVNDVISAKPHDRRLIIEEAAGITKYKSKKAAAERRMEACRLNLNRIVDIKNEVDKRVSVLARDKEKLIKVQTIKKQIQDIDLHVSSHQYLAHTAQLHFLRSSKDQHNDDLLTNQRDVAFLEQTFSKTLDEYAQKHDKRRLLSEIEQQHKTSLELFKKDLEYTKSTFTDNKILVTRLTAQLDDIDKRMAELQDDKLRFSKEYESSLAQYNQAHDEFLKKKLLGQEVIEKRQKHLLDERDGQKKIIEAATRAARLQTEINVLREQDSQRQIDIKNASFELENKNNDLTSAQERLAILNEELNHGMSRKAVLEEKLSETKAKLVDEQERFSQINKRLSALKDEHVTLSSRLSSLKEIDERFLWSDSGVFELVASEQAHVVKGIIANVVKAKPGSEDAVEKCLAHMLDAAIVSNNKDLLAAVSFLKSKKSAKTAFFMLDHHQDQRSIAKPLGLTSLNDLVVIAHQDYMGLRTMFDHVFLANNLVSALDHWPAARMAQATIVSLEGEVLLPDGRAILLGQDNGKGILKRKNELAELGQKVDETALVLDKVVIEAKSTNVLIQGLMAEQERLVDEVRPLNIGMARLEETLKQKKSEIITIELDIKKLQDKTIKMVENKSNFDEKITDLSKLWSEALDDHKSLEELLENVKSIRVTIEAEYEAFQNQVKEIEITKVGFYEKSSSLKNTMEQAEKSLIHLSAQKQSFTEQIDEKSHEELKLKEHERQTENKIIALDKELKETLVMLEKVRLDCDQVSQIKEAQELELARLKTQHQTIRSHIHEKEIYINNIANDIKNLCDRIAERYRLKLAEQLTDFHHRPLDEGMAKKERDELKRICDRMGAVNENAGVEFDEFSARSQFLHSQVSDLNDALNQLEMAIKKINKTTKIRFTEAFNSINKQFSLVFPRLFNGGKAELVLCDEEDLLNCGVEIIAKPPGKNIGSIELMSGGEKALTAISLIMAIFLIKPSPFCLLDEVDAPLDEANVARFSQLIKEMSSLSQFIVITHNRKTMESADQLYGVTMEDAGQSKIVSVHIQQAYEALKTTKKPASKPAQLTLGDIAD